MDSSILYDSFDLLYCAQAHRHLLASICEVNPFFLIRQAFALLLREYPDAIDYERLEQEFLALRPEGDEHV